MLYRFGEPIAGRQVGGRSDPRRASISDDLVIEALQPFDILQIGMPGHLLGRSLGAAVRRVGSLHEAAVAIAQHEFDASRSDRKWQMLWPTSAYEQIARLAGPTPVLVQADVIGPMAVTRQREDRENGTSSLPL